MRSTSGCCSTNCIVSRPSDASKIAASPFPGAILGKEREETARGRCAYYLFQRTRRLHRWPAGWEGPHMNTRRLSQGGLRRGRLAAMLSAALIAVAGFSSGAAAQMLTTLYTFTGGSDGGNPYAGLIADAAGNLYGTTYGGGATASCDAPYGCGTVFKLAPSGILTVLYSFTGSSDGAYPFGALVADAAGNLYGTNTLGGATASCNPPSGCGTVFELVPSGSLTGLHSFTGFFGIDGTSPYTGLIADPTAHLLGTT